MRAIGLFKKHVTVIAMETVAARPIIPKLNIRSLQMLLITFGLALLVALTLVQELSPSPILVVAAQMVCGMSMQVILIPTAMVPLGLKPFLTYKTLLILP